MAEALLNQLAGAEFEAVSAGIEPGLLNPIVVEAMRQIGIDISKNSTKSVASIIQSGASFDYVITVCDDTSAERCPIFPDASKRLHWPFPDPSSFAGSFDGKLAATGKVRDQIRDRLIQWLNREPGYVAPGGLIASRA
jgi:arsenate reductase